jgi:3alpha(or 20beta)-hydroxysteroid dehydrogenase
VNVASIDALEGEAGVAAYAASKWGLRGLTRCAALELGRWSIRVNAVHPGGGNAEMREPAVRRVREALARGAKIDFSGLPRQPLGRSVTLAEIASVILFLASDEASFCSGGDYAVDGAFTAGHIVPGAPGTY